MDTETAGQKFPPAKSGGLFSPKFPAMLSDGHTANGPSPGRHIDGIGVIAMAFDRRRGKRKKIPAPPRAGKKSPFLLMKPLEEPANAFLPPVRVELLGNRQAIVDGCRGIIEYSDSCIRLSTDRLILKFTGTGLTIKSLSDSGVIVEGTVLALEYS